MFTQVFNNVRVVLVHPLPTSCTVICARMSHWKWRETKLQPSRARSGQQNQLLLSSPPHPVRSPCMWVYVRANLCISISYPSLTYRGHVRIEQKRKGAGSAFTEVGVSGLTGTPPPLRCLGNLAAIDQCFWQAKNISQRVTDPRYYVSASFGTFPDEY